MKDGRNERKNDKESAWEGRTEFGNTVNKREALEGKAHTTWKNRTSRVEFTMEGSLREGTEEEGDGEILREVSVIGTKKVVS